MIKKFLMITLYLALGYQAKAAFNTPMMTRMPASERSVSTETPKQMKNICMMEAGDVGKLKYKGKTYEQAFSKVTDECFQRRTKLLSKPRKCNLTRIVKFNLLRLVLTALNASKFINQKTYQKPKSVDLGFFH